MSTFERRLEQLKSDLITQGDRVVEHTMRAVEAYFESDTTKAAEVVENDNIIDRVDVEIERASVPLLIMGCQDETQIRWVLTIVKINNELERIADCAVDIAEVVQAPDESSQSVPNTFRVMANSVIGMVQDSNKSLTTLDVDLAQRVLSFDDAVSQFERQILINAQERVASGEFNPRFAYRLLTVTHALDLVADHCTNICEQLIYLGSGKIVRHLPQGWSKPISPESA